MHARSFLTTLALGYLTLGVDAKCRHSKSRTLASVTTTATVTASPSGFTTILTGSSTSTRSSDGIEAVTTTTTTADDDDDDSKTTTTTPTTTPGSGSTTTSASASATTTAGPPPPVFNPIFTPDSATKYHVGDTVDITWGYDAFYTGLVTINLIGGHEQNTQQPLGTLITNVQNSLGKWTWTINQAYVTGEFEFYGLSIVLQGTDFQQYSMPLNIYPAGSDVHPPRKP